jgi:hypothetical protein
MMGFAALYPSYKDANENAARNWAAFLFSSAEVVRRDSTPQSEKYNPVANFGWRALHRSGSKAAVTRASHAVAGYGAGIASNVEMPRPRIS